MSVEMDFETRLSDDDHQALRLWLRLLSCTTRVEDQVRQRLRADFGTTLPRFDLLAQLERHPDGLTMRELSKRLMVTGGNVTGITDQLESEGLVLRETRADDRRSFIVKLTPRAAASSSAWPLRTRAGSSRCLQAGARRRKPRSMTCSRS